MRYISYIAVLIITGTLVVGLYSCASTGSPSGGPRDTDAPVFEQENSSPNFSTNYTPEEIVLVFDEFIELKNQNKEILISPPFFRKPKITQRGKKIKIKFPEDEPLRPDATYTVNFGRSIVDFTESNPLEDFRFLFATGDKIDSLTFGGTVVDAYGGQPAKEMLVMLYDLIGDSVVVADKPFYFARTGDSGTFDFANLKNDTFKLIVIEDLNLNYLLDPEIERLAFSDSLFVLTDSMMTRPELRLFLPEQSLRIVNSTSKKKGQIQVVMNKDAEEVGHEVLYPTSYDPYVEYVGDTVRFWSAQDVDSVGLIFGHDTLDFYTADFDSVFYSKPINLKRNQLKVAPFDSLILHFSSPLVSVDTSLIRLTDIPKKRGPQTRNSSSVRSDTMRVDSISIGGGGLQIDTLVPEFLDTVRLDSMAIDSIPLMDTLTFFDYAAGAERGHLWLDSEWLESSKYRLQLLPGAMTDLYGRTNDTLIVDFSITALEEYGNIEITFVPQDSAMQYICILKQGDKDIAKSIISESTDKLIRYELLPAGSYSIVLIEDVNRDGKWTTGDYWLKRQPELLKEFKLEDLRENWDLEATISWSEGVMAGDGSTQDSMSTDRDSMRIGELRDSINLDRKSPPSRDPRGQRGEQRKERGNRE